MELFGYGRRGAHAVASALHGFTNGLWMTAGYGGNLVERESLNTIKEESFAVGAVNAVERGLHQGNHLLGVGGLFGTRHPAIRGHTFARPTLDRKSVVYGKSV